MKIFFLVFVPLVFSFSLKNIASGVLDFVPGVSNVKGVYEAYYGKDLITGEELSTTERTLSFIGAIPFGNYLTIGKHFKNGQKYFKAAQRAKNLGKIKNALNFAKAGARAMQKAYYIQNKLKLGKFLFSSSLKATKWFSKKRNKSKGKIKFPKRGKYKKKK